jgi:4,5-DOPA dioxygenase extradiol
LINYQTSHVLEKLAAPTPHHCVSLLYSLGLLDAKDGLKHFYEGGVSTPAFREHSFIVELPSKQSKS